MASTHKHIRSSTANKRPTTAIADGQIALNTNSASPGLFFKDSTGATIIKIGPVHVGATAPNASPAAGGSAGNSSGEVWLDNSLTPVGVKIWNGSAWVNATPIGSTTVQGLLELATDAETQAGSDNARAVTPASLQSKVSDSTSTTSSTTIASSTAVKAAYDLANAALPKTGGTITGNLEIGTTGSLSFEGSTADGFETTIAVVDPTADRTITLPNTTGTVVTTGDTGTITSTMLADGTIVDADISATAEIAVSKLADGAARQLLQTDAAGTGVEWTSNIDIPGTLDVTGAAAFDSTIGASAGTASLPSITFTGDTNTGIYSPGADQIAISTNGTQRLAVDTAATTSTLPVVHPLGAVGTPSITFTGDLNTGIWSPAADTVAASTGGSERLRIDSSGRVGIGTASPGQSLSIVAPSTAQAIGVWNRASDNIYGGIYFKTSDGVTDQSSILNERAGTTGASLLLYTKADGGSATERARIDSSGRLLVGTSSTPAGAVALLQVQGYSGGSTGVGLLELKRGAAVPASGDELGRIDFSSSASERGATITAARDGGTWTTGSSYPGRLVFSVTADGASSPTEAVRISQNRITQFQNDIIPGADNAYQVGQSGRRWSVVFAGTGTINTSDANLKQDIEALEQAELNVAAAIKGLVKKFRFIDAVEAKGGAARIHIGVIAQEVEQAFIDEGLDPRRYAMFCEDTVEDGSKRLGIRYDELLAFVITSL